MAKAVCCGELNLTPGTSITIIGRIIHHRNYFRIDMGKDGHNLALHLSFRFGYPFDRHVIAWNTMENWKWGHEQRDSHFPFDGRTIVEISILYEEDSFTVTLPDGHKLKFPNRTKATKLDYLEITGDIHVSKLAFA
ncbi:galectin-1-like [Dromiciops gliroides]|uniref:galectin-1-like n=1 Tax=Dromiciops gliroides TaxID=33562 RepID=UPI001CC4C42C|nr:galectin-1-like [Dromiciops gliroides]